MSVSQAGLLGCDSSKSLALPEGIPVLAQCQYL